MISQRPYLAIHPWPISPNIAANKNENVITANKPGFTSRYDAISYASIMVWSPP